MKIFLDSANIGEIKECVAQGIIDGVTTNPSLVARENRPFRDILDDIVRVLDGPISAEVIGTECDTMLEEARELADIHPNIVVKIPLIAEGLKAVKILYDEGIKTNVTLAFTPLQAMLAAKAGATYVSPFVGRLDDIVLEGMSIIADIINIWQNYEFHTEILVASVRNPLHILRAATMGADIVTVPFKVLQQLLQHPLTEIGLANFLKDWEKVPK